MSIKLLLVSRYPPVHCGVGEYTRMLAVGLRTVAPSLKIYVASSTEAGSRWYVDGEAGARIIPSFERGEERYEGVIRVLEEIGGADVVHVQHEYGIFGRNPGVFRVLSSAVRKGLASAALATLHTVYHRAAVDPHVLEVQRAASQLDAVVVHSFLQEFELEAQGFDPTRLYRIPHGTLVNPYLGHSKDELLRRVGVDPSLVDGMLVVTPGFLRPDKGLDVLASAVALTERRLTVIVAGEPAGVDRTQLPSMRGRMIVIDRYLSGDEILMLAAASDIIVLPYKDRPGKYSVSGILHLSMGSLKPLVGTRVPRLVELYQYAPSLTVPPRSPEMLARRLEWVTDNYDLAAAYSSELFAYAARTQWPRVARAHLELYRSLIEGRVPLDIYM